MAIGSSDMVGKDETCKASVVVVSCTSRLRKFAMVESTLLGY